MDRRYWALLLFFLLFFSGCCALFPQVLQMAENGTLQNPANLVNQTVPPFIPQAEPNPVSLMPIVNDSTCPSLQALPAGSYPSNLSPSNLGAYMLFFDGQRVGHNENWDERFAVENFRWNVENHPDIQVSATYNGVSLAYVTSVDVLPVFFVSADMPDPTDAQISLVNQHLLIAQARYKDMLKGRDTFAIAPGGPLIYHSPNNLTYFRHATDKGGAKFTSEILTDLHANRFNLTHVLLIIIMNPYDDFPIGGGIPINGGFSNGGGLVLLSSHLVDETNDTAGNLQANIEHETGHAFGLVHPDAYGYNLTTNPSIMAYNPNNDWHGLTPPATPGILIPEDIRALSYNKPAFPRLYFDPATDVPDGYHLADSSELVSKNMSTDWLGYRLYVNSTLVRAQADWSMNQSIVDYLQTLKACPGSAVNATYGEDSIVFSGTGYEFYTPADFFGYAEGLRNAHHPDWSFEKSASDLLYWKNIHPPGTTEVVGLYNGQLMNVNWTSKHASPPSASPPPNETPQ